MRPRRLLALAAAVALLAGPTLAQEQAPLREVQPTRASPALQDEIRPRVLAAAAAKLGDPSCRRVSVAETAFNGWTTRGEGLGIPLGSALGDFWEETWVIDLCGRIVDVLVRFAPPRVEIPADSTHLRP
ncbi:MAG: hypothetical protein ACK4NA_02340 [Alphaproteobacteria bacterium]